MNVISGPRPDDFVRSQHMRSGGGICLPTVMETEWGGLETLIAAAEFLESLEQKRNQKLIEICEDYLPPAKDPLADAGCIINNSNFPPNLKALNRVHHSTIAASSFSNNSLSVISSPGTVPSAVNGSPAITSIVTSALQPSLASTSTHSFSLATNPSASNHSTLSSVKIPNQVALTAHLQPSPIQPCHHPTPSSVTILSPPTVPKNVLYHLPQKAHHESSQATTSSSPSHRSLSGKANADMKRKLSSSGTREVHNKLEKNRRAHLKKCFELLKSQIPAIHDEKKPSNLTILRTSIRYVQILRRREHELESELERLAREKIVNQQRLTTLKKELSARWDHIDFNSLLPESVESIKATVKKEDGSTEEKKEYDLEKDAEKFVMSDIDDSLSHIAKSKEDTYNGSSSPSGSCSISSLRIESPNVMTTVSENLPPQIHIVEAPPSFSIDNLPNSTVVNPLQFLSASAIRMITDTEPASIRNLKQEPGNDVTESTSLSNIPLRTGNTYTIISDSFMKINNGNAGCSTVTAVNSPQVPDSNDKVPTNNSTVQILSGIATKSLSAAPQSHNIIFKPVVSQEAALTNIISSSNSGHKKNGNATVLTSVPGMQPSIGNKPFVVAPAHLPNTILSSPPVLKTERRLQPINGHQLVVKPAVTTVMMVNSSASATK